jgi:hypothetical protein
LNRLCGQRIFVIIQHIDSREASQIILGRCASGFISAIGLHGRAFNASDLLSDDPITHKTHNESTDEAECQRK